MTSPTPGSPAHPSGSIAARFDDDFEPWRNTAGCWISDAEMAYDGWVPVREAADQPITLDALRDAWEGAEVANECNEGDILILRRLTSPTKRVSVWRSERPGRIGGYTRILHRAPKPKRSKGDERLDAMLKALVGDPALLADWLAERGVPVPVTVPVTEEGEK